MPDPADPPSRPAGPPAGTRPPAVSRRWTILYRELVAMRDAHRPRRSRTAGERSPEGR